MAKNRRDPAKESFWREVLQRHAASGLAVREFCQREQLAENLFYSWRRTIGERDGRSAPSPAFAQAMVKAATPPWRSSWLAVAGCDSPAQRRRSSWRT